MSVTPANRSIAHPLDVPGKNPTAHNLDNNVYAAQAPKADPGAPTTPATPSPEPPAKAQHDIFDQHMHEKHELEKEQHDKAEERKHGKEEKARPEFHREKGADLSLEDTFNFALIDIERGISQLRSSSAAGISGTYVHTAILYFEAAVARIDHSLDRARGGKRITVEQRALARLEYEKNYRDTVYPAGVPQEMPHPSPLLDKVGPNATVR